MEFKFLHCSKCIDETPTTETPSTYSRIAIGVTPTGDLWIGCERHNLSVAVFDNASVAEALREIGMAKCIQCDNNVKHLH